MSVATSAVAPVPDGGAPRGAYKEGLEGTTAFVVHGGRMTVDTGDLHAAAGAMTRAADALADTAGTLRLLDHAIDAAAALALAPSPAALLGMDVEPLVDPARLQAAIRAARGQVETATVRALAARTEAELAADHLLDAAALYDEAERQVEERWYFSPLFVDVLRGGLRGLLMLTPPPVAALLGPLVDRADPVIASGLVVGGAWWAVEHHDRGAMLGLQGVLRDGAPLLREEYGVPTQGHVFYNGEWLDLAGMSDVQRVALFLAATPLLRLGGPWFGPTNVVSSWPMGAPPGGFPLFGTVAPLPGSFGSRTSTGMPPGGVVPGGALPPAGGAPLYLRGGLLPAAKPVPAPPRTSEALIRDMPLVMDSRAVHDAGAIQVVTSEKPDGTRAHLVICPGTQEWTANNGAQPHDLLSNLEGVAGAPNAYEASIDAALRQAGVSPDEPIVLAGHSQGGILAAEFSADPAMRAKYDVAQVVTFGSPTAAAMIPGDVETVHFESDDDWVTGLDGAANPAGANRATVYQVSRPDQMLPGVEAHMQEAYSTMARDAREQRLDVVVDFERAMNETLGYDDAATTVTATTYQSVRADAPTVGIPPSGVAQPAPAFAGGGGGW